MTGSPKRLYSPFVSRLISWGSDLVLFALFLCLGVAFLEVIIQTIVLIVGFATKPDPKMIEFGLVTWNPNRHRDDFFAILKGALAFGFFFFALRFALEWKRNLLTRLQDSRFASFVGKRYLIAREGNSLANLITAVSVLGVCVGVMALVVVISVMNGFDKTLREKMLGVFSHIEVWPELAGRDDFTKLDTERAIYAIEGIPDVVGVAPLVQKQVIFIPANGQEGREVSGAILRGIDVERERFVTELPDRIESGSGDPGFREVVLGNELAKKLFVKPGDQIIVMASRLVSTGMGTRSKNLKLKVVGTFKTGLHDVDATFAYANLKTVQDLFLMGDNVSSLHLKVEDVDNVAYVRELIMEELPVRENPNMRYLLRTWQEINPEFFAALRTEKIAMFIILTLIVVVAALNIIGTLVMVVTQKTREIGILKSMGATPSMILRIFLFHGFFIGLVGTALGIVCGLWICRFVEYDIEKIFKLPPGVYGLDRLPVITDPSTICFIALVSLVICTLAGVIPSLVAAQKDPVESLRYT